jgi:hypothetical protein
MNNIYNLETIDELKEYISNTSVDKLRPLLLTEFDRLINYKNIKEWNELVRVCEALSITGWGDKEAFEATANKWINGAFYTELQNKFFEQKLEWSKGWSKQKETFVIDKDHGISKFASQRNKLPKSPIRWSWAGNYQSSVQPLIDSLQVLKDKIVRETRPELYGDTFSYILIHLNFSHHDDKSPSMRYEYFHDEIDVSTDFKGAEISDGRPAYYIRPRLDVGKLSTKENELRLLVSRYFTKEFGFLDISEQKKILHDNFLEIIDVLADKLKKKKIKYDTELLKQDTSEIFTTWL